MSGAWPAGYAVHDRGGSTLIARRDCMAALLDAGMDEPAGWERRLGLGLPGASGRGTSVVVAVGGVTMRLKQMRRGGVVGRLWRDRFAGRRRLRENLVVAQEARERGVATPAMLALLMIAGPVGLHRAWLATEEIAGAVDLAQCLRETGGVERGWFAAALGAVKHMHDLGVEHRDLNLGNLLVRSDDPPRAWIVDLDRARLHPRPLGLGMRRRALARLERSCAKSGVAPADSPNPLELRELYAGPERSLALELARGRRVERYLIALHRVGWRR